jgi:hypothetical protein
MKAHAKVERAEAHAFCPVCGKPFSETEKLLADRTFNFQCHHCWNPVRKIEAHGASHHHSARPQGRVIPMAGKHRR